MQSLESLCVSLLHEDMSVVSQNARLPLAVGTACDNLESCDEAAPSMPKPNRFLRLVLRSLLVLVILCACRGRVRVVTFRLCPAGRSTASFVGELAGEHDAVVD